MFDTDLQRGAAMAVTSIILCMVIVGHIVAAVDQFSPRNALSASFKAAYPDAYAAVGGNTSGEVNPSGGAYSIILALAVAGVLASFVAVSVEVQNLQVFNPFRNL